MELFRKKNTATAFVFPLVSSGSNAYYTASTWTDLTNRSISAYSWSDTTVPSVFTLSQTPIQLSATGLWNLSATADEMNPNSGNDDYIVIKLKADQIQEQTLLVILTNYSIQKLADIDNKVNSNQVQVSGINGGLYVGTSAYMNFPQVYASGVNITNPVIVSAYQNFPQVQVSGMNNNTITSAVVASFGVLTSADYDSTFYNQVDLVLTSSHGSGSWQQGTDAVRVSAIDEGLFVGTSAYTNFPQVLVSGGTITNVINPVSVSGTVTAVVSDILSAVMISGTVTDVINPVSVSSFTNFPQVTVSAYQNFPSVNVSSIDTNAMTSSDFAIDYYDKIQSLNSVGSVNVSSIDGGLYVGTSAYQNFPEVKVSGGTVDNITNPVSVSGNINIGEVIVSAYKNFPQVSVSAIDSGIIENIKNGLASAADLVNIQNIVNTIDTKTSALTFNGSAVNAFSVNEITIGSVTVSAYENFPQVQVSGINTGVYGGVSAYQNFPSVTVSANLDKTGYALSTTSEDSIVDKVWDEVVGIGAIHNTSGTAGYNVGLLPNINNKVGTAVAGVPQNYLATSGVITNGNNLANNYSATWYDDGVYWQVETTGGIGVDLYLTFALGASVRVSQVTINGRFTAGAGRFCNVFAYNYVTSSYNQISDSTTRMNNTATDINYTYNLVPANRSPTGEVIIRFYSPSTTNGDDLYLDQVLVKGIEAGATPEDIAQAVYDKMAYTVYDGKVWIDQIHGFSGTDVGIYGIPTRPVNNLADATIIANETGIDVFYASPETVLLLTSAYTDWVFDGYDYWILLNGQNIADTTIKFARVSGTSYGEDQYYNTCMLYNTVLPGGSFVENGYMLGTYVVTSGTHNLLNCQDITDTSATFILNFQTNGKIQLRKWSGGIQINNYDATNDMIVEGKGRLIIDSSCTGGSITVRGFFSITDNSGGAVNIIQDARYNISQPVGSVTNPVSISGTTTSALTSASFSTDYYNKIQSLESVVTIGKVQVSGIDDGVYVGTSAYTNFPEVYVSAIDPAIQISAVIGPVTVSAYQNFPQVTVSANLDKTNYTISAGIVNNVSNPVTVSAYQNFPQVYVSGIGIPVTVSGNVNINSDQVFSATISAIDTRFAFSGAEAVVSANVVQVNDVPVTIDDMKNSQTEMISASQSAIDSRFTFNGSNVNAYSVNELTLGKVQVSGIDEGIYVGTSAYQNFPEVYVSAIDPSLIGSVNVSSIDADVIDQIQSGLASASDLNSIQNTLNTISAVTNIFTFNGSAVNAYSVNEMTVGEVTVSAYKNFPQVYVSGIGIPVSVSGNVDVNMSQIFSASVSAIDTVFSFSGAEAIVSANVVQVNDVPVTIDDMKNSQNEMVSAAQSAIDNRFTFSGSDVMAYTTNIVPIDANIIMSAAQSAIDNRFTFSGSDVMAYATNEISVSGMTVNAFTSGAINEILNSIVDTKTLSEILTILLANAVGNTDRNGYVFTYYKQDGITPAFQNTMTSTTRRRTI